MTIPIALENAHLSWSLRGRAASVAIQIFAVWLNIAKTGLPRTLRALAMTTL